MPCSPNDVSFPTPVSPSGLPVPGFGIPFSIPVPGIPFPPGFPEDLLDILNELQMLLPPGALKPALNPNFEKDIFDGIMKLLDQFMPFLMLYKFFLPVLNLIICIIEVLCALMNPFALVSAIHRLFNVCLPQFLNLFPIFALIVMIISLLILLLALIEYIIAQILKLVQALLRNINALVKAMQDANATGVLAIAHKLGALLCVFQNTFVLLVFFGLIIEVIADIISLLFSIPPCEGGGPGSTEGCCAATYCPTIVQGQYTRTTGNLQYLGEVGVATATANPFIPNSFFNVDVRAESYQLYDPNQNIAQAFWNIVDGYDVSPTIVPKPVFFPTDAKYSATTSPQQAAYTVDLRLFYNPVRWGRPGIPQYIRFNNCIVLAAPTQNLELYNLSTTTVNTGVLFIAGGLGYLDDGKTPLDGYQADGVTPLNPSAQATLENFLHFPISVLPSGETFFLPSDGYTFSDMQYTFKPNIAVLLQKNLVTLGCQPDIALSRAFVNNVMFANVAAQTANLTALIKSPTFPNPTGTEECLLSAISALRSNMTVAGVAEFQATADVCLSTLQTNTQNALASAIGIGFSPCNSNFTVKPDTQFTTLPITVSVNINENNGLSITQGLPPSVSQMLASQIVGYPTFGKLSSFTYDGYQAFTADLTSDVPGSGSIMVAFQNQILCTDILPTADGYAPSHTLQSLDYQFVYAPRSVSNTGVGGSTGEEPRRTTSDLIGDP